MDDETGLVLGNLATPIPVTLDGRSHTVAPPTWARSTAFCVHRGVAEQYADRPARQYGHAVREPDVVRCDFRVRHEAFTAHRGIRRVRPRSRLGGGRSAARSIPGDVGVGGGVVGRARRLVDARCAAVAQTMLDVVGLRLGIVAAEIVGAVVLSDFTPEMTAIAAQRARHSTRRLPNPRRVGATISLAVNPPRLR